jgi:LysM domain
MPTYVVQQGDCLSNIADQNGLKWETIWNDPNNSALRQKRLDPNVLYPGDELFIPDRQTKELPRSTDQRHKFVKPGARAKIKIQLLDDYKPRASVKYELEIDGVSKSGVTDGNGFVEQPIPPGARRGRLLVGEGTTKDVYELRLGELDPLDTEEGVRGRLVDLGFGNDNLNDAISAFQRREGLDVTGEANDGTRSRLKERFGQ